MAILATRHKKEIWRTWYFTWYFTVITWISLLRYHLRRKFCKSDLITHQGRPLETTIFLVFSVDKLRIRYVGRYGPVRGGLCKPCRKWQKSRKGCFLMFSADPKKTLFLHFSWNWQELISKLRYTSFFVTLNVTIFRCYVSDPGILGCPWCWPSFFVSCDGTELVAWSSGSNSTAYVKKRLRHV